MNSIGILFFCVQTCLFHTVYSQYLGGPSPGYSPGYAPGIAPNIAPGYGPAPGIVNPYASGYPGLGPAVPGAPCPGLPGPYGGAGTGDVAVFGELPVAGTTVVGGQVPILGTVQFGGPVAAAGSVSISGFCSCGCGPY